MNTDRSPSNATTVAQACTAQRTIATPLGPLLIARTDRGLAGAWFDLQRHHPPVIEAPSPPNDSVLDRSERAFADYFAGNDQSFDLPLDLIGTEFQRAVWQRLLAIPRGRTTTYGAIAREIGAPAASRAVGAAVGRNPVSVVVPCHRVVGSDGSLTGYAGGLPRKTALLRLEGDRSRNVVPQQAELLPAD